MENEKCVVLSLSKGRMNHEKWKRGILLSGIEPLNDIEHSNRFSARTFLFCLFFCWQGLLAQIPLSTHTGLNFGVSFAVGTHVNRMGLFVETYTVVDNELQLSSSLRFYQSMSGYGPKLSRNEIQLTLGALIGFGPAEANLSPFLSPVSNQTGRAHSFAYAYNFYLDDIGTSQRTATIAIEVGQFSFIAENDAFADPILDRFRTGTFMLAYEDGDTRIALNSMLWTGDPASKGRRNIIDDNYPARYGCVDLSNADYGRFSHGILALQVQRRFYTWPDQQLGQIVRFGIGLDAEQIRHAMQNRFIHDAIILPKSWRRFQNRHVPMLDTEGNPYLFHPGQKIRKPRFFAKGEWNPGLFY